MPITQDWEKIELTEGGEPKNNSQPTIPGLEKVKKEVFYFSAEQNIDGRLLEKNYKNAKEKAQKHTNDPKHKTPDEEPEANGGTLAARTAEKYD